MMVMCAVCLAPLVLIAGGLVAGGAAAGLGGLSLAGIPLALLLCPLMMGAMMLLMGRSHDGGAACHGGRDERTEQPTPPAGR
jgi:hypothetical protein